MSFKGNNLFDRRKRRVRFDIKRAENGRARLTVHRTNLHIYAQVIEDATGRTVAQASTVEKDVRKTIKNGGTTLAAQEIGKQVAARALKVGVKEVVFDRGGYLYHGRVKALADAARETGLQF
ncbi:MAG: 50S ribosomal protein L18 [Alphaproteobacteria bacterium 16-39-46]|nr:MAG: 50S ribosomal protein L18 [Alphaproteobacteria bacterium 16-39-46]OZA42910.1 MAG: 50S ribosomal protein L18 [Alphaproteobacteria bacterium 17-39-52]HQS84226.1 50S ribosomal protein L18 [Alphaproteobacteria bacterium]HQS94071.1 50S ribosomal protein L18 [Alphaproteobacteria bacterium]